MFKYIVRRLVQAIPTFFGITILSYLLLWLAPGSVVERLYLAPHISAETRARLKAQLGIDDPFHIQYLRWLIGDDWMRWDSDGDGVADSAFELITQLDTNGDGEPEPPGNNHGILRGDFGRSFVRKDEVMKVILTNLPATLELTVAALITALVIGIPVGVVSAAQRGRLFDMAARVVAVLLNAVPNFWLGLILLLFFGSFLHLLPLGKRCLPNLLGVCPPLFRAYRVSNFANNCFGGQQHRRLLTLRPHLNARGHEPGLHPNCPFKRAFEPRCLFQTRDPQCHDPNCHLARSHHH